MSGQHWTNYLVGSFRTGKTSTVEITVDPDRDGGMILVASRIRGIYDALKGGREALSAEDTDDLLWLADHLHRVLGILTAAEDSLLLELRERGVGSRRVANAWDEDDHKKILRRYGRIERAAQDGRNSSALIDAETDTED